MSKLQGNTKGAVSNIVLTGCLAGVVCIAVLAAHWPVLSAQALSFDDTQYFTENVLVQNPSWGSARRFLTEVLEPSTIGGYYQPLPMISLMLDYAAGARPENLMPIHRTSLTLHISNTVLIIVLLYMLFGNAPIAAGLGLLFGIHPLTVEPVAWIGERKTLLAMFFALWSLILYVRYTRKNDRKLYLGCIAAYVLALMSKPTSLPLPILMLLMDYWPLRRLKLRMVWEKLPLLAIGTISAAITYISQSRTAHVALPTQFGPGRIPMTFCHNIIFYLQKILWPSPLSAYYAFPKPFNLSSPPILIGVIGTCVLIPLLVISLRWTRGAVAGWLFFFIAILPTMHIITFSKVIAADKFAYLPSVGLLTALAGFLCWFCSNGKSFRRPAVVGMIILILAGAGTIGTRRYLKCWRDTVSLFENILVISPGEESVHTMYAFGLVTLGKVDEAEEHFRRALEIRPDYAYAHYNLAALLESENRSTETIEHYREAIKSEPNFTKAYNNLGNALLKQGKFDEAAGYYLKALQLEPEYQTAYNNLGNALRFQGKLDEAVRYYDRALQINPDYAIAHYNLGITLESQGKFAEAVKHYKDAIRLEPQDAKTHYGLAKVLSLQGKFDQASIHYQHAIRIGPQDAQMYYSLGNALRLGGRFDEAIKNYHHSLRLKPDFAEACNNLALALKSKGRKGEAIDYFRQALKIEPDFAKAWNNLGATLAEQGKINEAADCFGKALLVEPDYAQAHSNLGGMLTAQGKYDEAIEHFRRALEIKSDFADARKNLQMVLKLQEAQKND